MVRANLLLDLYRAFLERNPRRAQQLILIDVQNRLEDRDGPQQPRSSQNSQAITTAAPQNFKGDA